MFCAMQTKIGKEAWIWGDDLRDLIPPSAIQLICSLKISQSIPIVT
jgi:hypothetical protein